MIGYTGIRGANGSLISNDDNTTINCCLLCYIEIADKDDLTDLIVKGNNRSRNCGLIGYTDTEGGERWSSYSKG